MSAEQVVLVGMDGLGWGEIEKWVAGGTLSTIGSLRDAGTWTTLTSTHPPWTPCAWPSLLSGRNPGRHGVFDFFTREDYDKRLVDRSDVKSPYVYEIADAQGLVPVVVNYPVTHPATELDSGAVVPGYVAPEDVAFHPPRLRKIYESEHGPYRLYPDYTADNDVVAEYVSVARCRRDMTRLLDERYDWDFLAVQFQVTDSVFHALDDQEKIRRVLVKVDEFADDIITLADDDAHVFIVSDHGMGDYSWTFYVNSWLADNGYCETTQGKMQYFPQIKSKLKASKGDGRGANTTKGDTERGGIGRNRTDGTELSWTARLVSSVTDAFSVVGLTPRRIHRALDTVGLAEIVEMLIPQEILLEAQNETVDVRNSTAFQLLFNSFGVHLNVEGRETAGRIPQDQYDSVRDELMSELASIRDPSGNRAFEAVRPREEVYTGENIHRAPDIILIPTDYQCDVSGTLMDTWRRNRHKNHKPEGILVSNRELEIDRQRCGRETDDGPLEQRHVTDTAASIYDVAPTIASALGLSADSKADGRILPPFSQPSETEDWDEIGRDYMTGERLTAPSDVESRLADLGYLD